MIVYCFKNVNNGKRYVGITSGVLIDRWEQHVIKAQGGSPCKFHRAIVKHGASAFVGEILQECTTPEELRAAEIEWIARLGTLASGYNMTRGGDGVIGYTFTAEARARMSAGQRGRKHSIEERMRLREQKLGAKNPMYGKPPSDEHRRKLSEAAIRAWARKKSANVNEE